LKLFRLACSVCHYHEIKSKGPIQPEEILVSRIQREVSNSQIRSLLMCQRGIGIHEKASRNKHKRAGKASEKETSQRPEVPRARNSENVRKILNRKRKKRGCGIHTSVILRGRGTRRTKREGHSPGGGGLEASASKEGRRKSDEKDQSHTASRGGKKRKKGIGSNGRREGQDQGMAAK